MSGDKFVIPSLNGVRAAAVIIVFIGHGLTIPGPWPGHSGVTIFFFLSGYLITTLLRREHERTGGISLATFYLRRALRILPPAYLAIAATTAAGLLWFDDHARLTVWGVVSELLNVANYYLIFNGSADGLPPHSSMLWSLGVEEHFYFAFPLLLIFLQRRRLTRQRIACILIAVSLLAAPLRVLLYLDGASFYHLYTASHLRYDALLFGAAMALLFNPAMGDQPPLGLSDRAMTLLSWPAFAVFAACAMAPEALRLTVADTLIYFALMPIFWAIIAHPDRGFGPLLNARPVAWIGVLSYSLYLFHRLVIAAVAELGIHNVATDVVALALSLAVAQIVYITVERPSTALRKRLEVRVPQRTSD